MKINATAWQKLFPAISSHPIYTHTNTNTQQFYIKVTPLYRSFRQKKNWDFWLESSKAIGATVLNRILFERIQFLL